jgi:glycosyltransferase involved in cell wall biosynthesis
MASSVAHHRLGAPTVNVRTKISIAMAVYNGERFIREQLESFASQTRLPDELIISDDASSDRSMEMVREFARRAPFPVRILANLSNLGCTRNFERAIRECNGDIIITSDFDDVWYPDRLRAAEAALAAAPQCGIAVCRFCRVDEALQPIRSHNRLFSLVWTMAFSPGPWCTSRALAEGRGFNHWFVPFANSMAFRGRFKPLLLPFPDAEDYRTGWLDFFIPWLLLCLGWGVAFIPETLIAYRQHQDSMQHRNTRTLSERTRQRLRGLRRRATVPLAALIDRLESPVATEFCVNPELRDSLLKHWRARCFLPDRRLRRIKPVVRELATLRYHRFSSGILTAAKDLIFVE